MNILPYIETANRKFGYARVSTKKQKLDSQLEVLNKIECDHVFYDHGISGARDSREGLDEMIAEIKEGDVVIVWKLDRLGRSVAHLAGLLKTFRTQGVHFCSITDGINTTTSAGKLTYHIVSAMAEFQRDIIRENIHAGLAAVRAKGRIGGRPKKLDERLVREAYYLMKHNDVPVKDIARAFEVSPSTVYRAMNEFEPLLLAG